MRYLVDVDRNLTVEARLDDLDEVLEAFGFYFARLAQRRRDAQVCL